MEFFLQTGCPSCHPNNDARLMAIFYDNLGYVGTKMSTVWNLLELGMMTVVVTTGAITHAKLQSNHQHQQTNTQTFRQDRCPSYRPTNSVRAPKGACHPTNSVKSLTEESLL